MNQNGKEHMAQKIVMAIQVMLNKKKSDPIMMKNKEDLRTDNEPEKKQTGLHHISSERKSAERYNLDEDESTRNNRKVIVAHEQECDGEEEDANKDGTVIREQAQVIADNTQSTRDNSKVCVALEPEYVDEEENANEDGIVIREQAQDIADTTQPGNVDKITEACRTSTRNKKNPSIRGKDFSW